MTDYVSLIRNKDISIKPDDYYLLGFEAESSDAFNMHKSDSRLIYPSKSGLGILEFNVVWEAGDYTEIRDVFVRDPLKITSDPDNRTGYDHRAVTPGVQCYTKVHTLKVEPGVPLGVYVAHDDNVSRKITMAQLKLTILD